MKDNERFPADLIVIASSKSAGTCYIETSSLDGEKNLKSKKIAKDLNKYIPSGTDFPLTDMLAFKAFCDAGPPNGELYTFKGSMSLGQNKRFALDADQLLLMGAVLRNTKWILGVTVYTGMDTRLMMNT